MGQSVVTHDFREDLAYSLEEDAEPFWESAYNKFFPGMIACVSMAQDMEAQKLGRDRVIYLENGDCVYIDEKKRREVYSDFCLEYISDKSKDSPGWMEKDLAIDYIAYAFMPTREVRFLPWSLLRRAWIRFKDEWIIKYKRIEAYNKRGYLTVSVAVPFDEVYRAIRQASLIKI